MNYTNEVWDLCCNLLDATEITAEHTAVVQSEPHKVVVKDEQLIHPYNRRDSNGSQHPDSSLGGQYSNLFVLASKHDNLLE